MMTYRRRIHLAGFISKIVLSAGSKCSLSLLVLMLGAAGVHAQGSEPDGQYLRIFSAINEADLLTVNGKTNAALLKYQEAHNALLGFKRTNLTWNVKMVSYRLNYLSNRLAELSRPAPAPVPVARAEDTAATQAAALPGGVQVRLLDAGAEPRTVLRVKPQPGDKQSMAMTMKMTMEMRAPGIPAQPMVMPTMNMPFEITIQNVSEDGDITYQSVMGEPTISEEPGTIPQVASAVKASLAGMKGMIATGLMSERGINKGIEVKLPPEVGAQSQQSLEQIKESMSGMATPLPEEAVGPGAKWEVRQPIKSQGMTIDQVAIYEVATLEADRFSATCTITQKAANQKISNPAMPAATVDLVRMTGTGTGNFDFNLAKLMVSKAAYKIQSDATMEIAMGNQKQPMGMKTEINIQLEERQ